jgi:hypothetical protein
MLKEVVDFLLIHFRFYPDMFRHMVAIHRGFLTLKSMTKSFNATLAALLLYHLT